MNNINPMEYHHNRQGFPNFSNSRITNNVVNLVPDSHLIRPIPKKIDLSKIIYERFMDPYPRQNHEMNGQISNEYFLFHKMYRDSIVSKNNELVGFSKQFQNTNIQFNNPRGGMLSHHFLPKSQKCFEHIDNSAYSSMVNYPSDYKATYLNSYMFNNTNAQNTLRCNQLQNVPYLSPNNLQGTILVSDPQEEDGLIDNHFSMSLNPLYKSQLKEQGNLQNIIIQERINKKSIKLQMKNPTEKTAKSLKRCRKSKAPDNSITTNSIAENSDTSCETPSDSSISPVSMVSGRSAMTPQTFYPNLNNLLSIAQDKKTNNFFPTSVANKSEISDTTIQTKPLDNYSNKSTLEKNALQGLPLKKRIKWLIEKEEDEFCGKTDNCLTHKMMTNKQEGEENGISVAASEIDKKNTKENNEMTNMAYEEDSIKTFQKKFLPMEKRPKSFGSDDSEDEEKDNRFAEKHPNMLPVFESNI